MESRGYQNLYPDLSPTKDSGSPFAENKDLNDEEAAFSRDIQRAKVLSLITAQQEEKQRLDKAMSNASNGAPIVPILKPPPRQPRQYFDGSSEVSKVLARPKPLLNPTAGEVSNNVWTNQVFVITFTLSSCAIIVIISLAFADEQCIDCRCISTKSFCSSIF